VGQTGGEKRVGEGRSGLWESKGFRVLSLWQLAGDSVLGYGEGSHLWDLAEHLCYSGQHLGWPETWGN
jgi:hypothetical protein